jgi:hypothetical protein
MHTQDIARGLIVLTIYAVGFWRLYKANGRNKVVECGLISILLVFVVGFASKANAPDWMVVSLGILLLLMCFLTVGLFARECYISLRRLFSHRPGH